MALVSTHHFRIDQALFDAYAREPTGIGKLNVLTHAGLMDMVPDKSIEGQQIAELQELARHLPAYEPDPDSAGEPLVLLMGAEFAERFETGVAEFYALVLLAATGMLVIASVNDFILLFVALELVTITFYILTSFLLSSMLMVQVASRL